MPGFMTTPTTTAKPSPKKASPAKPTTAKAPADKTGELLKLIARGWATELQAIASTSPTTAAQVRGMRSRTKKIYEAMREAEKTLGA